MVEFKFDRTQAVSVDVARVTVSPERGRLGWRSSDDAGQTLLGFGGVLLGVVFLFIVNWMAVRREHDAKKPASSLELAEAARPGQVSDDAEPAREQLPAQRDTPGIDHMNNPLTRDKLED